MTLTKAELAELLSGKLGRTKQQCKDIVETFFDEVRNVLENGDAVKLPGFGNFQLQDKAQRLGRNPQTGEEISIGARCVPTFQPSGKLKQAVDGAYRLANEHPDP